MEGSWVDYYKILEVNHQAAREVIEAQYKTLSKTYHPDVNHAPDAEHRMKMLNVAWEVLRDEQKRGAYHREWLRNSQPFARSRPAGAWTSRQQAANPDEMAPRRVISQYFRAIQHHRYGEAYEILSFRDRRNIPKESFLRWQESVAGSYQIEYYTVLSGKKYDNFPLGDLSCPAVRFAIEITERDLKSNAVSRYRQIKFAVKEDEQWHVYLGYRDIGYVVEQFSFLNGTFGENLRRHTDALTGLPNLAGFLEKSRPESYRCARYGRHCSVGVTRISMDREITDPDLHRHLLQQLGFSLRATVRLIDLVGALEEERFCVLLAETDQRTAERAVLRVARKVEQDILACFDTQVRLSFDVLECENGDITAAMETLTHMPTHPKKQ